MALTTCNATVRMQFSWAVEKSTSGMSSTSHSQAISKSIAYTVGTGANQANQLYAATRTLAASANETLDFSGSLTDLVGQTSLAFVRIKAISIRLLSSTETAADGTTAGTACSSITVGNASAPALLFLGAAAHTVTIPNGGFILYGNPSAAGTTVTNTTADGIKVVNNDGSNSAVYEIVVLGSET